MPEHPRSANFMRFVLTSITLRALFLGVRLMRCYLMHYVRRMSAFFIAGFRDAIRTRH